MKTTTLQIDFIKRSVQELRRKFEFAQACELLNHALEECDDDCWQDLLELANCFKSIHRVDRSIQIAKSLTNSSNPEIFAAANSHLAIYFELTGDFVKAEDAINHCIDIHPHAMEPQVVLARILGHQDEHERSFRLLHQILKQFQPRNANVAIRIFYQMAHACDAMAMYDNAFEWVLKAKEVQRKIPEAGDLAQAGMRLLSHMLKNESVQVVSEPSETVLGQLPFQPVHLIGFPRSGTTLLGEMIAAHPDVFVSSELPVVAEQIIPQMKQGPLEEDALMRLRERYFQSHINCRGNTNESILVDKKPTNLLFVQELLQLLPESRFLVSIRDPRDVVTSCFMRYFPLTDMSANFLSLGSGCIYYAAYMQIWRKLKSLLNSSNSVLIRYEDLCEEPEQWVGNALTLLGCDPVESEGDRQFDRKYIHSPTFAEVRKPVSGRRCGRWKNYESFLKPYLKVLDPIANDLGY